MSESSETQRYADRIIAFLDILGFKELVRRSVDEPEVASDFIHIMSQLTDKAVTQDSFGFEVTSFSDSIVASVPADGAAMRRLIRFLALVSISFVGLGFPLRGAITRGPLHHKGAIAFGPGLIRGYELERKAAIYPRIIVDPSIEGALLTEAQSDPRVLLTRQDDDLLFVNFLSTPLIKVAKHLAGEIENSALLETILSHMRPMETRPDVLIKQRWLRRYAQSLLL